MKKTTRQVKTKKISNRTFVRNSPRAGSANMPPDNSGMIQVPRPITSRNSVLKRTFKMPVTIRSSNASNANFAFNMYFPFYYIANGTVQTSIFPNDYLNTLNAFGVFKVKRMQIILQPLLISTTVPLPYVAAMSLEGIPAVSSPTYAALTSFTSAQQISPSAPTEFTYVVPTIASVQGTVDVQVYKGGWIPSTAYNNNTAQGFVILAQNDVAPFVLSTTFSQAIVSYEVWFKNPQ